MKTQTIKQRLLHSTMIGGTALMALVAAPAVTLMTPSVAIAQDFVQGAVSGTVTNQAGTPVSGAEVSLRSVNQGFTRSFTTDANGSFRAVALPPGSYEVVVNASGFNSLTDTVLVNAGGTSSVTLTLGASADNATQIDEVIVVGVRQAVSEFDATTTGLVVNVEELSRNVPIGRDATSLALLAPGVTQSDSAFGNLPSISGASAGENTYYVNGLNITDFVSFLGGSTVPFEFYQTFETKTGGYSAEFGRATGGVLNATTKSGGNEWEFGITGYWEPESLRETTPNTYLAINELDERSSWDVILEAGGPVIEDRLFVYGLYNARERENYDQGANNLGFRVSTDDPFYGAKVDFLLNDDHRLEATYWSDETTQETTQTTFYAGDAGSQEDGTFISEFGGANWIARYTGVWTDWLTTSIAYGENENNTRIYSDEDVNAMITDITGFDYNGDGIEDVASGLTAQRGNWLVGSPSTNEDLRKMFRADVDVYASLFGEHHFRFGLDYEKLESSQALQRSGEGYNYCRPGGPINAAAGINCSGDRTGGLDYRYQTAITTGNLNNANGTGFLDPIILTGSQAGNPNPNYNPTLLGRADLVNNGTPSRARVTVYDNSGSWEAEQTAFYLQDSWEVTDRLTLNLGVRNEAFENANVAGEVFVDIKDQWAPRLGATYDVFGDGDAKLFGFYGRYFLPVAVNTNQRLAGSELFIRDTWNLDFSGGANDLNADGIDDATDEPIFYSQIGQSTLATGDVKPIATQVDAQLDPMYVDEWILGYEQRINDWTFGIKGTYRDLGRAIDDVAIDAAVLDYCEAAGGGLSEAICYNVWYGFHQYVLTNPGEDMTVTLSGDDLSAATGGVITEDREITLTAAQLGYPEPSRTYKAVELTAEKSFDGLWGARFSYLWSDSEGNYEGALKSDNGQVDPGLSQDFDQPGLTDGAFGKLPGHREHTFKFFGSWQATEQLLIGANLVVQSPRQFGCQGEHATDDFAYQYANSSWFCDVDGNGTLEPTPRGSQFESDWLKNVDLTFSYDLGDLLNVPGDSLVLRADVFNVFNWHSELDFNEFGTLGDIVAGGFIGVDPNLPSSLNPNYGKVTGFQAPRAVRLSVAYRF